MGPKHEQIEHDPMIQHSIRFLVEFKAFGWACGESKGTSRLTKTAEKDTWNPEIAHFKSEN